MEKLSEENKHGQTLGYSVKNWHSKELPHHKNMNGKYCILEPLEINRHGKDLFDAFQLDDKGEDWTYLPYGPFDDYTDFEKYLSDGITKRICFAIINPVTQLPVGISTYHDIDVTHGVIEVGGLIFSRKLQKTIAATEAMYLMMKHVFDDLHYRRYQWRCNALNKGSRASALRLGFQFEGIFRHAHVFKGYNRDTAWFSILDNEWPALKLKFEEWLDENNFDAQGNQIKRLQDC